MCLHWRQAAGALSPNGFAVSVDELFQGRGARMALGAGGNDHPSTSSPPADGSALGPSVLNLPLAALAEQAAGANPAGPGQQALGGRVGSGSARAAPGQTALGGNPNSGSRAFQPYTGPARPGSGGGKEQAAANGNGCALYRGGEGGSTGSQPLDVVGLLQSIPSGGFGAAEAAARAPAVFLDPGALQALAAAALQHPGADPSADPIGARAPRRAGGRAASEAPAQALGSAAACGPGLGNPAAHGGGEVPAGAAQANGGVAGGHAGGPGPEASGGAPPAGAETGYRDEGSRWPADMAALLTNPALLAGNPALATLLVSAALSVGAPLHALAQGFSNPPGSSNSAATLAAPRSVKVLPPAAADGAAAAGARGDAGGVSSQALPGGPGSAPAAPAALQASREDPQSPSPTAFKENEGQLQAAAAAAGALLANGVAAAAAQHAGGCSGVAGSGLGLGQGAAGGEPPDALFSPSQYLLKECR